MDTIKVSRAHRGTEAVNLTYKHNYNYLATMGITEKDPLVGIIVSVYYLGCAVGAVIASRFADARGRRPAIFATLLTSSIGNVIMFLAGIGGMPGGLATMMVG